MTPKQLKDTPLPELKRIALEELNLTKDQVREYGHLSYRQTWMDAISDIRDGIKQLTITDALDSVIKAPDNQESENVEQPDITNDSHIAIELGWALPISAPHVAKVDIAEIINPANLIKLSRTNSHFKAWEPWMEIGRRVLLRNGTIHTILFFKKNGDCYTVEDNICHASRLDCGFLAKYGTPIIKNHLQFQTATSNELEVAALKNGFLHQGSKKNVSTCTTSTGVEAVPCNKHSTTEDEQGQLTAPEIINITPEDYPEIWELLQPPEPEEKQENYTINLTTYEVIQSSPESNLYTFESSTESLGKAHPKLPLEEFFKALFLGLPVLVPNQLA